MQRQGKLQEFAEAVTHNGAKDYVLSRIVPRHGLGNLSDSLKDATGLNLATVVNKDDGLHWHQVYCAFQVRHQIEHANGKSDRRFLSDVVATDFWRHSSWCDLEIPEGGKIPIREIDFERTCDSMLAAAPLISEAITRFGSGLPCS